jgi:hypothetical protein
MGLSRASGFQIIRNSESAGGNEEESIITSDSDSEREQ